MGEKDSSSWVRRVDSYLISFYRILPFTYTGLVRSAFGEMMQLKRKNTLLDLGCGDGYGTQNLNLPSNFEITGVDIFKPYLDLAKEKRIYKKLIRVDVRNFNTKEKFDIVLASHILEHLNKSEGKEFLKKTDKLAKKKAIIIVPIGKHPQEIYDDNKYQEHKSFWEVSEMRMLGYKVKSQGLKFLWGSDNVVQKYKLLSYIFFILSNLFYPLLFLKPQWGTYMICIKNK